MRSRHVGSVVVLVAMLASPVPSAAQAELGVRAGPAFATFRGEGTEGNETRNVYGLTVGADVEIPVVSVVGVRTGVHFVQKGGVLHGNAVVLPGLPIGLAGVVTSEVDLAYVQVPLLLQLNLARDEWPVGLTLYGGGTAGYNVSCDAAFTNEEGSIRRECIEEVPRSEIGLRFGADLFFPLTGTLDALVSGAVDLGLSSTEAVGPDEDVTNRAILIAVGVSWPVGG